MTPARREEVLLIEEEIEEDEDQSFEPCEFCPAFHPDSDQDFHDQNCPNR